MSMFDEVLLGMAQRHDSIQHLMDTFFSFLERKTDFFHVMTEQRGQMGFPPGASERLIMKMFKEYQTKYEKRVQPDLAGKLSEIGFLEMHRNPMRMASAAASSTNNEETVKSAPPKVVDVSKVLPTPAAPAAPAVAETKKAPAPAPVAAPAPTAAPAASKPLPALGRGLVPYNGSKTDRYVWSQTVKELTFEIDLPEEVKGKDIKISLPSKGEKVKIEVKGKVAFEGELHERVLAGEEDLDWTLDKGRRVTVHLQKDKQTWWNCFVKGDGVDIDTTKVDSTRKLEEFPDETQASVRKVVFDQNQKRKGLPTSEDLVKEEALRKAWDAEGSPFRGTPFDPSIIRGQGEMSYEEWKEMVEQEEKEDAELAAAAAANGESGASQ